MKSALALINNIRKKDRPKRNGFLTDVLLQNDKLDVCSQMSAISRRQKVFRR